MRSFQKTDIILSRLRGFLLLCFAILAISAYTHDMINSFQFGISFVSVSAVFILNLFFLNFNKIRPRPSYQLFLDLILSSFLLFFNGGFQNPFAFYLFFYFIIAPVFLKKKESIVFLILSCGILLSLHASPFSLKYHSLSFLDLFQTIFFCFCLMSFFISSWAIKEVSRLEATNEVLVSQNSKLDRYKALGLLASGVCHELGTPLNTIALDIDRMKEDHSLEGGDILSIERNLQKCIDSLRRLNLEVHDENVDFYEDSFYARKELSRFISQIQQEYALKIKFELNEESDFQIRLPRLLFLRSVIDMVENSLQANATELLISQKSDDNYDVLTFHDNGDGFPNEVLKNFGIPFLTSKDTGTGLGIYHLVNLLSIIDAKLKIANDHGAVIKMMIPKSWSEN